MSSPLAANECRRQVRYDYTADERIAKATGLAESLNRYTATENEKKRIAKDYDARLDIIQAEIDQLNNSVLSGYELREYVCAWSYDEPRPGRKTLRKREGGSVVAEEDMTERDRQMVMEIIESEAQDGVQQQPALLLLHAPENWPTADEVHELLAASDEDSKWIAEIVFDLMVETPSEDNKLTVSHREVVKAEIPRQFSDTPARELGMVIEWLKRPEVAQVAGMDWLCVMIEAYAALLAARESLARSKAAEQKKASRSGRRASSSGTVDIPADEGSRDDAGSESKTNL